MLSYVFVLQWMLEWNEQQVSWIYVQIVKMCDPELLVYLAQCLFQKSVYIAYYGVRLYQYLCLVE